MAKPIMQYVQTLSTPDSDYTTELLEIINYSNSTHGHPKGKQDFHCDLYTKIELSEIIFLGLNNFTCPFQFIYFSNFNRVFFFFLNIDMHILTQNWLQKNCMAKNSSYRQLQRYISKLDNTASNPLKFVKRDMLNNQMKEDIHYVAFVSNTAMKERKNLFSFFNVCHS